MDDENKIDMTEGAENEVVSGENVQAPVDNGDTLRNFFDECFIQYASYVVRDRAIPDVDDGLKPVQRRILYCMRQSDDGRFHKVAGVVGDTMHYHPHGDASIAGALVVLANKDYFIDRQGIFGDTLIGTPAAAPRYIECRLTDLARETLFNPEITEFVETYDGRGQEPVRLPAKLPALLMMGSEGIAVGMATNIFSHNFVELIQAEMAILRGQPFQLLPDFPHGGLMDASEYEDGAGKIRVRAKIDRDKDNKKVIIREIPPSTTTESLIESIEEAAKKGKLKIAGITDLTAENVCNIEISLQRGVYAEETIKELYAYTSCEVSLTSNILVIQDKMPVVLTVSQVLQRNVQKLKEYLKRELELFIQKTQEKILSKTLAQIFIENRIYKKLETCTSIEKINSETRKGLEKYKDQFYREITDDDINALLQIAIRRISAFDIARNQEELQELARQKAEAEDHLAHLIDYCLDYLKRILEKYGEGHSRRTELVNFSSINVKEVARRDVKVFHDKQNNFLGTSVKASSKDAQPMVLTEFDKIMLLRGDGTCRVIDIPEKEYIGPTKYVFPMNKDQIYRILYRDKKEGTWYVKRFKVGQFILGKEYHIVPENCLIEQLYTNAGVVVSMELTSLHRRSVKTIEVVFDSYPLRSRESRGFKITSFEITNFKVLNRGSASSGEPEAPQEESEALPDNPPLLEVAPDAAPAATAALEKAPTSAGGNAPEARPVASAGKKPTSSQKKSEAQKETQPEFFFGEEADDTKK